MKYIPKIFLSLMLLWSITATAQQEVSTKSVTTNAGKASGIASADGSVKIFWGIPYAAPPIGNLRWKAPQPVHHWNGIRKCETLPASAMQAFPRPFACWSQEFITPSKPLSEDCLYLNVWTSAKRTSDKKPVIVWIHGGGFSSGSGTVPLYDGSEMARKGVVFVTINYRLGIFGFFAHPQLSAESPLKTSGNYGILDQIAALKWVKQNIAAFGGDPNNVTIAGQSAGAYSVCILMSSPKAKGLFNRAIGQSGGAFSKKDMLIKPLASVEEGGKRAAESKGYTSIDQLRALSPDSLMKIAGFWSPAKDNIVVTQAYNTFEDGKQNDVPLLVGWNGDDGVAFGVPLSSGKYKEMAQQQYGKDAEDFLRHFPGDNDTEAAKSQKLISQLSFGWSSYTWAKMAVKTGKNKVFLYRFTHIPPGEPNFGAFHSAEFGYTLKTLHHWTRPFTDWDYKLSDIMSSYWVNFAKTGDPNGVGLPLWPGFDPDHPHLITFGDKITQDPLPYPVQMNFLDQHN
jgi:para-nitrobenzyl esterase